MNSSYRAVFQAMRPNTQNKNAILLISVGQKYHEGQRLVAAIDLINRSNFLKCTIMVADSLQRYNHYHLAQDEAHKAANQDGEDWIKRNLPIIQQIKTKYEIIRWDKHLSCDEFCKKYRDELLQDYNSNQKVREVINTGIEKYIARQEFITNEENKNMLSQISLNYMLEESAILMPLWANQGYDYIIYPKKMTEMMNLSYEKFVLPIMPDKVKWLPLRFRIRSNNNSNVI